MPTLEQQIAAKFLAALSATTALDNEKVDKLRVLLASGKRLKSTSSSSCSLNPRAET